MKNIAYLICGLLLVGSGILFGLSWNLQQTKESKPTAETRISPTEKSKVTIAKSLESLSQSEKQTIELFNESVPSVAFITTTNLEQNYWSRNVSEIPSGSGSGFIWDEEGHVVTNYHVIKNADRATVTLHDQGTYPATFVGAAPSKDLAVLKIDAPKQTLRAIKRGHSQDLQVGQFVLAIGNPFGLDYTLTSGIISALGREIKSTNDITIRDVIQTDAAINPGNSGGPLINSSGELIGVNTAIYSPSGAYAGIGFSIPVHVVKWVVPDLIKYGKIKRAVLGVELIDPSVAKNRLGIDGAIIMNVFEGKGAHAAGLRGTTRDRYGRLYIGDIISSINGEKIQSNSDLVLSLEKFQAGDKVNVGYLRNNEEHSVDVILEEN